MSGNSAPQLSANMSVITKSVTGAYHLLRTQPNQDACAWKQIDEHCYFGAVADGHGSSSSPRSDRGAGFAVAAALDAASIHADSAGLNLQIISEEIHTRWRTAVLDDYLSEPLLRQPQNLSEGNTEGCSAGEINLSSIPETEVLTLYGTTLTVCVIHNGGCSLSTIGDCDAVSIDGSGEIAECFPEGGSLGEETDSLCQPDAVSRFRYRFYDVVPKCLMLSTDGLRKSFVSDSGFYDFTKDIYSMLKSGESDLLEANLESWLREISDTGCGDDITVAIFFRA